MKQTLSTESAVDLPFGKKKDMIHMFRRTLSSSVPQVRQFKPGRAGSSGNWHDAASSNGQHCQSLQGKDTLCPTQLAYTVLICFPVEEKKRRDLYHKRCKFRDENKPLLDLGRAFPTGAKFWSAGFKSELSTKIRKGNRKWKCLNPLPFQLAQTQVHSRRTTIHK